MNKIDFIYFFKNIIITIIVPILIFIILILLNKISINDILIIISFIPWIFFNLFINLELLFKKPILFFTIPYVVYYIILIFTLYLFQKYKREKLWYIFTFIVSLLNIFYWFKVYILMTS